MKIKITVQFDEDTVFDLESESGNENVEFNFYDNVADTTIELLRASADSLEHEMKLIERNEHNRRLH